MMEGVGIARVTTMTRVYHRRRRPYQTAAREMRREKRFSLG